MAKTNLDQALRKVVTVQTILIINRIIFFFAKMQMKSHAIENQTIPIKMLTLKKV